MVIYFSIYLGMTVILIDFEVPTGAEKYDAFLHIPWASSRQMRLAGQSPKYMNVCLWEMIGGYDIFRY